MKNWSAATWVGFFSILAFIFYCAYRVIEAYTRVNLGWQYIGLLIGGVVYVYLNSKRLKPKGYLVHIHHYVWSGWFTSLICY